MLVLGSASYWLQLYLLFSRQLTVSEMTALRRLSLIVDGIPQQQGKAKVQGCILNAKRKWGRERGKEEFSFLKLL